MSTTQKIILGAFLAVGALCLIVGFTLMHYIGGFLRNVEEEAQAQEQADGETAAPGAEDPSGPESLRNG